MTTPNPQLMAQAALAEWIYSRDENDQAIGLDEISPLFGKPLIVVRNAAVATTESNLHIAENGFYYSSNGFGGAIVRVGEGEFATYTVVLRGTDVGGNQDLDDFAEDLRIQ